MRHALLRVVLTCATLALALAAMVAPSSTSGGSSRVQTYVLFAGHGVAVVESSNWKTGCNGVYMTTNYSEWRNITPPSPRTEFNCLYAWSSASFISPTDGWLLARNGGSTNTVLEHTMNGGRTWTRQPGGSTGSNAGEEVIGFSSATVGWRQQFATGSNQTYVLQHTTDAGATWSSVRQKFRTGCELLTDVFSTSMIGFAGAPLNGPGPNATSNRPYVWRTVNGGVTWSKIAPYHDSKLSTLEVVAYGLPVFNGRDGTLAVVTQAEGGGDQTVNLLSTKDFGLHWTEFGSVRATNTVSWSSPVDDGCSSARSIAGPLFSVAFASPTTWWTLLPGPQDKSTVQEGTSFVRTKGLPSMLQETKLAVADEHHGFVSIDGAIGVVVYETRDGGAQWSRFTTLSLK